MAVADEVQAADAVYLGRRDRLTAPRAPAPPSGTVPGWRWAGSAGRSRAACRPCRRSGPGVSSAGPGAARRASRARRDLVKHQEAVTVSGLVAQAARQCGQDMVPTGPQEVVLGVCPRDPVSSIGPPRFCDVAWVS